MRRLIVPLVAFLVMAFSCPTISLGGQVDDLLGNPEIGLDALSDYHAALTVSFSGTTDGEATETTETYTQSVWLAPGARFTTYESTGGDEALPFILVGDVGEAHYEQVGRDDLCHASWGPRAGEQATYTLASLLDPVGAARSAGKETVEGIKTRHYTFDGASVGLPDEVEANGEAWIAEEGGFIVKYSLQVTAADSYFGEGRQGTQQIEYMLSEVNAHPEVVYPEGCEPVLTDIPAMEDATDIIRLPGMLDYYSASSLDATLTFYIDLFESRGWVTTSDLRLEDGQALMIFIRENPDETAFVSISPFEQGLWVTISLSVQEAASTTTPSTTPESDFSSDPGVRVVSGLSILLGLDTGQPGLPSYHMEAYHQIPTWEGGGVVHYEDWMVADVEDLNVHFSDQVISPGGTTTVEAYLMGEEEYDVENGVLQPEGVSMTQLVWVLWPLDPAVILGTGASGAQAAGTETLDGRLAEIYAVEITGQMGAIAGASLYVTAVSGTVWIDQETGALLKAELDYEADVKDEDGNVMGSGSGRLEIEISQVNEVTVTLPGR